MGFMVRLVVKSYLLFLMYIVGVTMLKMHGLGG